MVTGGTSRGGPAGSVRDSLARARRRRFVGRAGELDLFRAALRSAEPPFAVLHVHGPGGVGKSALLRAFADIAGELGAAPALVDARDVEPSPDGFMEALAATVGAGSEPVPALAAEGRPVLLLDTYERLAPLDRWLRERFLPDLPEGSIAVLAGRAAPAPEWRGDPCWQDLLRVISLRNLPPDDSEALLRGGGVPAAMHERALALTHGHPLALSLLVDLLRQDPDATLAPEVPPDVVRTLLQRFLDEVPTPAHRRALEVAAHVRSTTEALLRGALEVDDAHGLFEWLRGLSFIDQGAHGLAPHDLARDVIDADLRWRDPRAYTALHERVRWLLVEELRRGAGEARRLAPYDIVFLHRNNPAVSGFWDWPSLGRLYAEPAGPADRAPILAAVERHEGAASALLAARWMDRQPGGFLAFRSAPGELVGFCAFLSLTDATAEDLAADPVSRVGWEEVRRRRPLRSGEGLRMLRFAMDVEVHQRPSPGFNLVPAEHVRRIFGEPGVGWELIAFVRDDVWAPLMAHIDFARLATVEGVDPPVTLFGHDWLLAPTDDWFRAVGLRELGGTTPAEPAPPPVVVLSQPEFADAVRAALRDLHRPDRLAANPLIRSSLLRAESEATGARLAHVVREAVARVGEDPRDERLLRALDRTYLRPAATQERAAEALGLPFSTYRRHLTQGVERVIGLLWEREMHSAG